MAKADVKAEAELAALEQELAAAAPGAGRLEVLVRMGRILFINRPDRCRSVLEDALVESQRCGDNAALASAVQMLAELAFQRGDCAESERLVERALATARAVGNQRAESSALNLMGYQRQQRGEYEEARSHYQQALDVSRESGYREGEQAALNQLGALAGLQGRPEEALEFLKRCLEIDDQLGDDYLRTVHLYNTGWALENLGRMDEAAEYCYRAIALAETAGYPEIKIDATSMLGEFYLKRDRPVKVDIRLVAATNQDLGELMAQGRFRNDLYYRLNTVELVLPPLRDRAEDIPELVRHFITRSNQEFGRSVLGASDEAMSLLLAYKWPGNIRELQHLVERAVLLVSGPVIGAENLPAELQALGAEPGRQGAAVRQAARRRPDGQGAGGSERALLADCLERAGWNVSEAAVLAGYSRAQFYRLLKKHKVTRPDQS